MAERCQWCAGADVLAGFDQFTCLTCGKSSNYNGERAVPTSLASEGVTVSDLEES